MGSAFDADAGADLVDAFEDASGMGIVVVDAELRFLRVTRSIAALNGISAEEHVGRDLRAVVPEQVARTLVEPFERVFTTGKPIFDCVVEREDEGQLRCWVNHFVPLRRNGRVVAAGVLVIDRTADRVMTQALRKSEEQFRTISDTAPVGVFLTDANGASLYSNHVNLEQMGLTLEESQGHGWMKAIHPEDLSRVTAEFAAATRERRPYRGGNRYLHRDGRVVFVEVKANGVFDGETPLGYVGVVEDITERRANEAALRESEMRFRELAENIDSAFWLASADHRRVLYVSPAFERIWGLPSSTLSDTDRLLATLHPDDRPILLEAMRAAGPFEIEYRVVRPDGRVRWISDRGFPVRDDAGVTVRQAGIATDITEQKALESQALQSQKLDSIGRLAGGIAHDFNNLLAVIKGQVEQAMRAAPSDDMRERLREIEVAANHAADLTRHLMTFARQQPVRPAVLDLNDVVAGVESLLRRLLEDDVKLIFDLAPDLAIVRADPTQVEQVIVNLVANARAAMPGGGTLTIATRNVALDSAPAERLRIPRGSYVELSVTDTGVGIAEADLPHIFEPFFTTRAAVGGTGLGLSTCYGIVRKIGGAMEVKSRQGEGSTFGMYLPCMTSA